LASVFIQTIQITAESVRAGVGWIWDYWGQGCNKIMGRVRCCGMKRVTVVAREW
jgi:hypothetical protein